MKNPIYKILFYLFAVLLITGCAAKKAYRPNKAARFVKGADIGWLPQMEATGFKFYNEKVLKTIALRY
jgi:arabinogalactan endo-1,4-beta-galactosidase